LASDQGGCFAESFHACHWAAYPTSPPNYVSAQAILTGPRFPPERAVCGAPRRRPLTRQGLHTPDSKPARAAKRPDPFDRSHIPRLVFYWITHTRRGRSNMIRSPVRSLQRRRLASRVAVDAGTTTLILPRALHERAKIAAVRLNWSLCELARVALAEWLD